MIIVNNRIYCNHKDCSSPCRVWRAWDNPSNRFPITSCDLVGSAWLSNPHALRLFFNHSNLPDTTMNKTKNHSTTPSKKTTKASHLPMESTTAGQPSASISPPAKPHGFSWRPSKKFQSTLPFSFAAGKPSQKFKKSHQRVKRQMSYHKKKWDNPGLKKTHAGPKMSKGVKNLDSFLSKNFPDGFKDPSSL